MGKNVAGWVAHLTHYENEKERRLAMLCLIDFGPAAAPAIPELLKLMKDQLQSTTRRVAMETLGAIGSAATAAIPDMLAALNNPREIPAHRATACSSAAQIDPESPAVRRAILTALRDSHRDVRHAAIESSVTLAEIEPGIVPALARAALTGQDAPAAATALSCLGANGVDPLLKALERGDDLARAAAADALSTMGHTALSAVPTILRLAQRERDPKLRGGSVLAAVRIAPKDESALDSLAELMAQSSVENVAVESRVLIAAGPAAAPALRLGLRSPDAAMRKLFIGMMTQLKAPPPGMIDDLLARTQDKDSGVRLAAIQALDAFGPAAASAKVPLQNLSRQDPSLQRAAAVAALNVSRDPNRPRYRTTLETLDDAALLALLKDPNPLTRQDAADALRTRTNDAPAVASALIDALKDDNEKVRITAARSLSRFGQYARTSIAVFIDWLESVSMFAPEPAKKVAPSVAEHEDMAVPKAALMALAGMGADARGAMPTVVKFALSPAADRDPEIQKYLGVALQVIGPDAVPLLVAELKNPDASIRLRSARAVASMGLPGATAIPDLIDLSQSIVDSDAKAGFEGLQAMGLVGYGLVSPHLVNVLMTDLFAERRTIAARTLGIIGIPQEADGKRVLDALQSALLDPDESVCRAAHTALVKIGPPALPRLRELLKLDEGQSSYWWAVRVMARLKADPSLVIPKLIELTQPGVREVKQGAFAERGTATELLGEYAPVHLECIPVLVRLLADRDDIVSGAAQRSLALFGAAALDSVRAVLRGRNPVLRRRAVETLDAIRARTEHVPLIE